MALTWDEYQRLRERRPDQAETALAYGEVDLNSSEVGQVIAEQLEQNRAENEGRGGVGPVSGDVPEPGEGTRTPLPLSDSHPGQRDRQPSWSDFQKARAEGVSASGYVAGLYGIAEVGDDDAA